ncbi:MAG: hypothetical protein M3N68_02570 [Actinomycetota bacterium]|nr:hypothetical protein [Actinomycetota bacterium]
MEEHAVRAWFDGRLPEAWSVEAPEVAVDRDEIVVVVPLGEPEGADAAGGWRAACIACVQRFREETRDTRMRIAEQAEHRFGRKVSWGAECGDVRVIFTHLSVPVMTRLRMPEREVLDTLVQASVARSRSEALAWCVRLVGQHQGEWIGQLKAALRQVEKVRSEGPAA